MRLEAGRPDAAHVGQARAHGLRAGRRSRRASATSCWKQQLEAQQGDLSDIAEPAERLRRQDDVGIGEAGVDDDAPDRRVGEQRCHQLLATQPTSRPEHLFLRRRNAVEGGHGLDEPAVEHRVHRVRRRGSPGPGTR